MEVEELHSILSDYGTCLQSLESSSTYQQLCRRLAYAFQTTVSVSHPTISKLLTALQREQSLHEATLAKWEAGEVKIALRTIKERNERLQTLVSSYEDRETLSYLRGIAYYFDL